MSYFYGALTLRPRKCHKITSLLEGVTAALDFACLALYHAISTRPKLSVESQKGIITIKRSFENKKGAIVVQSLW